MYYNPVFAQTINCHLQSLLFTDVNKKNIKENDFRLELSSIYLLNRRIDLVSENTILEAICNICLQKTKIVVSHYNIHAFNLSTSLPQFLEFQQNSDIVLCDGMGIIKGLNFLGINIPFKYKVSLTSLIPKLLQECDQRHLSVFLLGSTPDNLEKALSIQKNKHPYIRFASHHGYFDHNNPVVNQTVIKQINQFKPDILIVGMGMPQQELWIQKNYEDLESLVTIPCGAIIDRLAGLVPTSPAWISNVGLEWLHRLIREPKRLAARYLLGNPLFFLNLLWAKYNNNSLCFTENEDYQDIKNIINTVKILQANKINKSINLH